MRDCTVQMALSNSSMLPAQYNAPTHVLAYCVHTYRCIYIYTLFTYMWCQSTLKNVANTVRNIIIIIEHYIYYYILIYSMTCQKIHHTILQGRMPSTWPCNGTWHVAAQGTVAMCTPWSQVRSFCLLKLLTKSCSIQVLTILAFPCGIFSEPLNPPWVPWGFKTNHLCEAGFEPHNLLFGEKTWENPALGQQILFSHLCTVDMGRYCPNFKGTYHHKSGSSSPNNELVSELLSGTSLLEPTFKRNLDQPMVSWECCKNM